MARSSMKLTWNGPKVIDAIKDEARTKAVVVGEHIRGEVVVTLSGQRSGRTYRVPGTQRTYTASAPGEPPASRLGRLRQDVSTYIEETGDAVTVYVGTRLLYGLFLERGTYKMRPRPWLAPTIEREQGAIKDIMGAKWTL